MRCNQDGALRKATVSTTDGQTESYGLARNFKKRWPKHKTTLKDRNADGQTTLSKYVWKKRDEGLDPKVKWKFLEKNIPDFNPITGTCKLCTREKYQIALNPNVATLNLRTEIFSHCRHKATFIIGDPQINFHFLLNSIIYLICLICYLYVLPIVDLVYVCLLSKLPEDWLENHETLCSSDLNKLIFLYKKFPVPE